MNSKYILPVIVLVGLGVFALPATTALFSGQHSFYNIDATGNQIPCTKCHGDVKAELSSGGSTTTGTPGPHANFQCEYCHRAEAGMASGDDAYAKITYNSSTAPYTDEIYLVTTIQNFETGNFPKKIDYQASFTLSNGVDSWTGYVYDINGTVQDYGSNYSGSLSTNGNAGQTYNYELSTEVPTYTGGAPKDTNTATQNNAFDPRLVTWNGSTESLVGAGSREVTTGTKYHAASLVSCLECHGGDPAKGVSGYQIDTGTPYNHAEWLLDATDPNSSNCWNCHYGSAPGTFETNLAAGGFGLTTAANDTGEVEAHKNWVMTNDTLSRFGYGASNGACVACHTHVAVEIEFQKGYLYKINAIENATGVYNVQNFSVNGTVNVTVYGNASGNIFAVSDKNYSWSNDTTLYINGSTALVITGLNGTATSDSNASLQGQ